jgi:hypothetical protein
MMDSTPIRGNPTYYDETTNTFHYTDGTPVPTNPSEERPCTRCGKSPTPEGYDACLGFIEGAKAACCGHGIETGYIAWEVGKGLVRREYGFTLWKWRFAIVIDHEVEDEETAFSDTRL